jgi:hypothetical protein
MYPSGLGIIVDSVKTRVSEGVFWMTGGGGGGPAAEGASSSLKKTTFFAEIEMDDSDSLMWSSDDGKSHDLSMGGHNSELEENYFACPIVSTKV